MQSHITKEDRKTIEYCIRNSWSFRETGRRIERNVSVISREVKRNGGRESYRHGKAHKQYLLLRKKAKEYQKKILPRSILEKQIEKQLKQYDSPQQISGQFRVKKGILISHETIYQWIYKERRELQIYLRCQKGKWRRRRGTRKRAKHRRMKQFRCIESRAKIVEERGRLGDWEGDTVIGKNRTNRILTYVDRKSGYACAAVLPKVSSEIVQEKTKELFLKIPLYKKKTITFDRGTEFGGDDSIIEEKTKTIVYRAHAYHSWERGTNENWNGLLRQFFPKGTDFATLSQKKLSWAVKNLNHRPRKRLNYYTPHEVFVLGLNPSVAFQT